MNHDTKTEGLLKQFEAATPGVWIVTPETLNQNQRVRKRLTQAAWRKSVLALNVDEAHTILDWKGFRPDLLKLSGVLEMFGSRMAVGMLSATLLTQHLITAFRTLGFEREETFAMDAGTERPELFFMVRPLSHPVSPVYDTFQYILPPSFAPLLRQDATPRAGPLPTLDAIPKAVVFCETRRQCLDFCTEWRKALPAQYRHLFAVFTGATSAKDRQRLLQRFKSGDVRVVFATEAFGLGCDVPNIDVCIHVGKAELISSLIQHMGRAGRLKASLPQRNFPLPGRVDCVWLVPPRLFGGSTPEAPHVSVNRFYPPSRPPIQTTKPAIKSRRANRSKDRDLYGFLNPGVLHRSTVHSG